MIKHVVMWKLKEEAGGCTKYENALKIKQMLEALPPVIKEIRQLEVGIDMDVKDGTNSGFDACLITMFDSEADLEIYQNHPAHKKVSAFVMDVRTDRAVVDWYIDE